MADKEKQNLTPINGIIDEQEELNPADYIDRVMVIIEMEGEEAPVCIRVESKEMRAWIVEALFRNEEQLEEDVS